MINTKFKDIWNLCHFIQ